MLRVHAVAGNRQWLDGGAMFGNAPRALWERWCPPDALGRIELACRAMLVEEDERRLLFDPGVGAFFDPATRERYGVDEPDHVLLRSLAERGLSHEAIDLVVLSHLHFDHAGGLLAPFEPGREPALLFPNARYLVGETALERARRPHARDRASFVSALPGLLEASGRLHVMGPGEDAVLGRRYRLYESEGHTPGLLLSHVLGARRSLFFASDLAPSVPWLHLPITMGYDRFPERLVEEKGRLFEHLHAERALLFFYHDPRTATALLDQDERGRWRASDARPDTGDGLDLD